MGNLLRALCLLAVIILCGCSPGYVFRAAYEEGKILVHREDISAALTDPTVSDENKEKLGYVREARSFAETLGLTPQDSFTKFAPVNRDVLSWVVMGCRKDSFTPHTWWFPVVGRVPYKGFFDKEDADAAAKELEASGYETWIRGTDAFSTLGWFNDPILSTTLRNPTPAIVNTVIHEITHTTFWFKGTVEFNETLANFVGTNGAALFFDEKLKNCGADTDCVNRISRFDNEARLSRERTLEVAALLTTLYDALDTLYKSGKSSEEKITERVEIFDRIMEPLRAKYPTMKSFASVNNAEILQLKIYLTHYDYFQQLYEKCGGDLPKFISSIRNIFSEYTKDASRDPFTLLSKEMPPS